MFLNSVLCIVVMSWRHRSGKLGHWKIFSFIQTKISSLFEKEVSFHLHESNGEVDGKEGVSEI